MSETEFNDKAEILADIWLNYRDDEEFQQFIEYNDLGLPLAYSVANDIIENNPVVTQFVNETFQLLLDSLEVEDTGFESFDDMLGLE